LTTTRWNSQPWRPAAKSYTLFRRLCHVERRELKFRKGIPSGKNTAKTHHFLPVVAKVEIAF
jgi:hypothetical protein